MYGVWLVVSYFCNAGDKDWSANFAQETHGACCSIKAANSAAIELACSMLKEKGFADPDLERKLNFAQQDRSSDDESNSKDVDPFDWGQDSDDHDEGALNVEVRWVDIEDAYL